jgi:hypothetical protein
VAADLEQNRGNAALAAYGGGSPKRMGIMPDNDSSIFGYFMSALPLLTIVAVLLAVVAVVRWGARR